jgi:hypothetical protein
MGAGVSQSKINQVIAKELKALSVKFNLGYKDLRVSGRVLNHFVEAWYRVLRASNGEVALALVVKVGNNYDDKYGGSFESKLKELGVGV